MIIPATAKRINCNVQRVKKILWQANSRKDRGKRLRSLLGAGAEFLQTKLYSAFTASVKNAVNLVTALLKGRCLGQMNAVAEVSSGYKGIK